MTLGFLSRGDVDHGADEARGMPLVEDRIAGRGNPTLDAVVQTDCPIFDVVRLTRDRGQRFLHRFVGGTTVVRMNACQECVVGDIRIGRQSKHRLAALVPAQNLCNRIKIPGPDRRSFSREVQAICTFQCGLLRAHPLNMRPRSFGDIGQQREFIGSPLARHLVVDRHQRGQAPLDHQWDADGGRQSHTEEGLRFLRHQFDRNVVENEWTAGAQILHRELSKGRKAVVADNACRAARIPFPADGEVVLVRLHVRIGANGDFEMPPQHLRGCCQDAVGVDALGGFLTQHIEKAQPRFILAERIFECLAPRLPASTPSVVSTTMATTPPGRPLSSMTGE